MLYTRYRSDGKETKFLFHAVVTCCIVGVALGIALPIDNLGTVLEFTVIECCVELVTGSVSWFSCYD